MQIRSGNIGASVMQNIFPMSSRTAIRFVQKDKLPQSTEFISPEQVERVHKLMIKTSESVANKKHIYLLAQDETYLQKGASLIVIDGQLYLEGFCGLDNGMYCHRLCIVWALITIIFSCRQASQVLWFSQISCEYNSRYLGRV